MKTPLRTILSVAAAVTLFCVHADVYKGLTFSLSDESTVTIPLSSSVEGEIQGDQIVFSDGTNSYSVEAAKISSVKLDKDNSSAVGEIEATNVPEIAGRTIRFSNLPVGSVLTVCTVDGRIVKKLDVFGDVVLSLEDCADGIYLVNVNKTTIKIALK